VSAGILNFALGGLVAGAVAAMLVALLAMRRPRLAATLGTLAFPLVLVVPLMRSGAEIAVDHRRAETTLSLVCVIVAVLLVLRELYGHLGARRRWTLAPAELRAASGIDALFIDPASTASAHGVFRRAVVIPSTSVPPAVLLHERAHHVWRDPATAAFRRLVRAAFWFHPGLSILEHAIRQASELAADAAAARSMTPAQRATFATLLVASARPSSTVALGAGELEERVRALLGAGRGKLVVLRLAILVVALLLVPLVPQFVPGNEVIVIEVIR
jgi:BlaR1 peptidase M56